MDESLGSRWPRVHIPQRSQQCAHASQKGLEPESRRLSSIPLKAVACKCERSPGLVQQELDIQVDLGGDSRRLISSPRLFSLISGLGRRPTRSNRASLATSAHGTKRRKAMSAFMSSIEGGADSLYSL